MASLTGSSLLGCVYIAKITSYDLYDQTVYKPFVKPFAQNQYEMKPNQTFSAIIQMPKSDPISEKKETVSDTKDLILPNYINYDPSFRLN